jgi:hypothetical protein
MKAWGSGGIAPPFITSELDGGAPGVHYSDSKSGHPVPVGYKYGNLALQVGRVSNLRQ